MQKNEHWRKVVVLCLSIALHLGVWLLFDAFRDSEARQLAEIAPKIKIKIAPPPSLPRQIIETPQERTAKPKDAKFLGETDHIAKTETKTKPRKGEVPTLLKPRRKMISPPPPSRKLRKNKKTTYAQFLQQSQNDIRNTGFADFVTDNLAQGDIIDLNTNEYRYIGYFTALRKAIDLAWIYPDEAIRKGQYGVVHLRFAINADGTASRIKITKSSGHRMLDVAIVDAIRLASPFTPLPDSFNKERLLITGSFWYILHGI